MEDYSLLDAITYRRSRRFGRGMRLNGGPLEYESAEAPQPLTVAEEAALVFGACGITGHALAELPYQDGGLREGGGGYIMTHFVARTVPSGDAMHNITLFVLNDEGAWLVKRPQDYPREEIPALVQAARERRLEELYERGRVRIADRRPDVPRELPYVAPFNKWSANQPGTTYFLPVADLTTLYINILLSFFDEEFAFFAVDERNGLQPAGVGRFARSAGGHLYDDPAAGRVATVEFLETWLCEFVSIEQGGMLQNLGLMTQALGLGGFPHFAAYPAVWPQVLGFRMETVPMAQAAVGAPPSAEGPRVPMAVGLERDGRALIRPFCPPHYRNMEEAVLAFLDYKYAEGRGTFRDGGAATAWQDGARVQESIPRYSDQTVEATIAYCTYIHERYGRFPACGPIRTLLAYQAHRLDTGFYDRFYRPDSLSETQRKP